MPKVYPKDTYEKRNERKSFQIFLPLLNPDCWEHLGSDHNDHGVDHAFEYIEEGEYRGYRILSQLKSRTNPEVRDDKMNALEKNTGTVRVFVPLDNKVEDDELHEIAKSQYTFDDENGLRKIR